MADSKHSRAQSRLEKAARETGGNAGLHYEVEAKAVREKIARLRALRMAKESADKSAAADEDVKPKKLLIRRSIKSTGESGPPMSLGEQPKGGLRD
jgi:hypothetical protein